MRHFKWPLIVTGVCIVAAVAGGILAMVLIAGSGAPQAQIDARATLLGQGLGVLVGLIMAPFWIYGAASFGTERRARLQAEKQSAKSPKRRRTT